MQNSQGKNQTNADLIKAAVEIKKLVRHMALTMEPLEHDVHFAGVQLLNDEKAGKNHQQFWRRTVIRCLLAATEALLWNMKHIAPKVAYVSRVQLTPEEIKISETKFLRFPDNVKATFLLFGKVHGVTVKTNFDQQFDALCKTYSLRNRLMHPKTPFDPNVSDLDISTAQQGVKWFLREYRELMHQCSQSVDQMA
jgi:hypothetical protein